MDDRLKKDLQDGPLTRHGFNDRLRARIDERLGESPRAARRRPRWFGRAAAGLIALILVIAAAWQLPDALRQQAAQHQAADTAGIASTMGVTEVADEGIRSALLIGLRQDLPDGSSSYRTLLFAPEDDELRLEAQGAGLLVPHGQKFWRVETAASVSAAADLRAGADSADGGRDMGTDGTDGDSTRGGERTDGGSGGASAGTGAAGMLTAYPADTAPKAIADAEGTDLAEKVMFVGNTYIAIRQTAGGVAYDWVKDLAQLQGRRNYKQAGTPGEPHMALAVSGDAPASVVAAAGRKTADAAPAGERLIDNWTVVRKPGGWALAESPQGGGAAGEQALTLLPNTPELKLVNDDQVTVSWDIVKESQPAASDVFSSRNGDLAAVITDRNLIAYGVRAGELKEPGVTVPLLAGETVVMAQWSAELKYTEIWKDRVPPLLAGLAAD